jgi:hypothetical protein
MFLIQFLSFCRKELDDAVENLASGLDSFYLLFAGALVFFMQTGFAMVSLSVLYRFSFGLIPF